MTQAQLGAALNVSPQAVSKWELDSAEPDLTTLKQICTLFDISTDEILGVTVSAKTETTETPEPTATVDHEKIAQEVAGSLQSALSEKEEDKTIGFCKECGKVVTKKTAGMTSPRVICKNCLSAKNAAAQERHDAKVRDLKKIRNRSLIWSSVVAAIVLAVNIYVLQDEQFKNDLYYMIPMLIIFTYGIFAMVSECIIGEGPVADILLWFITRPIKFPVFIFDWDIDGILLSLAVKIVCGILAFLLGVLLFFLGVLFGSIVAIFTYPFHIVPLCRDIRKGNV